MVDSGLEVFAQNVETVRRLTHPVRDPRASYEQTLAVLAHAKRHRPRRAHEDQPDARARRDGRRDSARRWTTCARVGVDILTLGQYLRPTVNHLAVERFVRPTEFEAYREAALERGFLECVAGPLVRSSYRAEQALARNNAGLGEGGVATRRVKALAIEQRPSRSRVTRPSHGDVFHARLGPALARSRRVRADLARDAAAWTTRGRRTRRTSSGSSSTRRSSRMGMNARPEHLLATGDIPVVQIDRGGAGDLSRSRASSSSTRCWTSARARARRARAGRGHRARDRRDARGLGHRGASGGRDGARRLRGRPQDRERGAAHPRARSYHGLALNVAMDLEPFRRINPCGYAGLEMTQVSDARRSDGPAGWSRRALAPRLLDALGLPTPIRARPAPGDRT